MTHTEYTDALMDELERRNFNKVVNHYRPPIELMASYIYRLVNIGMRYEKSIEEMANIIEQDFAKITSVLFPSKEV